MDSQFSEPLQEVEVQAKIHAVPVGFSTGEKTVKVFADTNRSLQQDPRLSFSNKIIYNNMLTTL
jgi:hypothetical protein